MARTCASCRATLSEGARFCRSCGAPAPAEAEAEPTVVLPPDDPRCRSCGADLASSARFCRSCGSERSDAPAVVEKETATAEPTVLADPPTPVGPAAAQPRAAAHPAATAPPPTPPPQPPAAPGTRSRAGFVALVAVLVVVFGAIGGTAAYLLFLEPDDEPTRSVLADGALAGELGADGRRRDAGAGADPEAGKAAPGGSEEPSEPDPAASAAPAAGALPDASEAELEEEIAALLLEFHEAVVDDRAADAWDRLSSRKQRQIEREDGFAAWSKAQASLASHLDPSGLTVSIDALDDAGGVARVRVDGMTWSDPDASCSEWSGLTWVKYEDGAWRYDPGYSTTAARERTWKPRFSELLGGSC